MSNKPEKLFERRERRVRARIRRESVGKLRLTVTRSNGHIYAQVIDDVKGVTVTAASSLDKSLKSTLTSGSNKAAAAAVGKLVAEKAAKANVKEVVFDRGGYLYHGRVKALAEAARENGLVF